MSKFIIGQQLNSRVGYPTQEFILQSKESIRAEFNRTKIANSTIMYTETYTEYDEIDIYEAYEAASFDEDTMGAECELLALVEFGTLPFDYPEGY